MIYWSLSNSGDLAISHNILYYYNNNNKNNNNNNAYRQGTGAINSSGNKEGSYIDI